MKYKKGDKVKILAMDYCLERDKDYTVGEICEIKEVFSGGYKVWTADRSTSWSFTESQLAPVTKDWDSLAEGDIVIDKDGVERVILGICGKVFFVSKWNDKEKISTAYAKKELIEFGYTIKQDTPVEEVKEMTVADVEKLVGSKVKIVK